jgi:hypothetical protein
MEISSKSERVYENLLPSVASRCPRTTNDMPIVEPASFAALGLVPFRATGESLDDLL